MKDFQKLTIKSKSKEFDFHNTWIEVNGKHIPTTEMNISFIINKDSSDVHLTCVIPSNFVEIVIEPE